MINPVEKFYAESNAGKRDKWIGKAEHYARLADEARAAQDEDAYILMEFANMATRLAELYRD